MLARCRTFVCSMCAQGRKEKSALVGAPIPRSSPTLLLNSNDLDGVIEYMKSPQCKKIFVMVGGFNLWRTWIPLTYRPSRLEQVITHEHTKTSTCSPTLFSIHIRPILLCTCTPFHQLGNASVTTCRLGLTFPGSI